ncbi:MAG: glycosyltransferase family 4 protein [bacterium]|nr:glycosyltransferase family 4 protein [bacterium]
MHQDGERIADEGFELCPLPHFIGDNLDPLRELKALGELRSLYRRVRPDLVHHIGLKMSLTGSLATRAAGVPRVLNTFTGLGFLFTSAGWRGRLIRRFALGAMKSALVGKTHMMSFQNGEDRQEFIRRRVVTEERTTLIRGSGVDPTRFSPSPDPDGEPVVLFASRMLRDKGVVELVEAARILKRRNVHCRVLLAGLPDHGNPRTVTEAELEAWHEEGAVEWLKQRDDMPALMADAHIACLPSYREGLPRFLLEAAAATRPIVASDIAGCREVVRHEGNGLLVPPRDPSALAQALERLIADADLRVRLGRAGRVLIEEELCDEHINRQTVAIYRTMLASAR